MIRDLRIAVIGAGVMGEAMIGGLLKQELVAPEQIVATEPRPERRAEIEQRYGIRATEDNVEAAHWAQVAIFSVKPQTLPRIMPELRGALREGELVISIVAGAPMRHFVEGLGHRVTAVARTHSEAVKAVDQHKPGLVLADIQLADGSSGLDAVNEMLGAITVPVIFITAYPDRLLTGERPEPAFLITKPYQPDTVKAIVSQALFFERRAHLRDRTQMSA